MHSNTAVGAFSLFNGKLLNVLLNGKDVKLKLMCLFIQQLLLICIVALLPHIIAH